MATAMIGSKPKPTVPGFYWVAEAGEEPHIVEVGVESDSNDLFFVTLPDDDYKYPLSIWNGALWFGPVDESDLITFTQSK